MIYPARPGGCDPASDAVGPAFLRCGGASPPTATRSTTTHVAHRRIKIERVYRPYLTATEAGATTVVTSCWFRALEFCRLFSARPSVPPGRCLVVELSDSPAAVSGILSAFTLDCFLRHVRAQTDRQTIQDRRKPERIPELHWSTQVVVNHVCNPVASRTTIRESLCCAPTYLQPTQLDRLQGFDNRLRLSQGNRSTTRSVPLPLHYSKRGDSLPRLLSPRKFRSSAQGEHSLCLSCACNAQSFKVPICLQNGL
jgi:hypothetical protein